MRIDMTLFEQSLAPGTPSEAAHGLKMFWRKHSCTWLSTPVLLWIRLAVESPLSHVSTLVCRVLVAFLDYLFIHSLLLGVPARAVHERRRRMQVKQSGVKGKAGWEEWAVCKECGKWRVLPADHGARLDPEAQFCCTDIAGMSCRRSQQPYNVSAMHGREMGRCRRLGLGRQGGAERFGMGGVCVCLHAVECTGGTSTDVCKGIWSD